ncbi:MAG: hypothetical protein MZV63_19305 [Marinilabiliales bacterium]|nr:hypothetical protein [Marinilabiliales bacterium]
MSDRNRRGVRHRRANVIASVRSERVDEAAARRSKSRLYPFLDLVIRLWLAQVFWVSGVLKLANWDNALHAGRLRVSGVLAGPGDSCLRWASRSRCSVRCCWPFGAGHPAGRDPAADPDAGDPVRIPRARSASATGPRCSAGTWSWARGRFPWIGCSARGLAASALPLVKPLGRLYAAASPATSGPVYQLALRLLAGDVMCVSAPVLAPGRPVPWQRWRDVVESRAAGAGAGDPVGSQSARAAGAARRGRRSWRVTRSRRSTGCIELGSCSALHRAAAGRDRSRSITCSARQLRRWFPPLESWSDVGADGRAARGRRRRRLRRA